MSCFRHQFDDTYMLPISPTSSDKRMPTVGGLIYC